MNVVATPKKTADKERQSKSKATLLQSGGKRISVNLSRQSVCDLNVIATRDGTDISQSIAAALSKFVDETK